ncbi:hypothetical protein PG985_015157 [Apiospora marii]|uniref:uncharacterized protein n=1 Tax=Apiospora marii TaxID=335849 RepID=UPI003131D5C3
MAWQETLPFPLGNGIMARIMLQVKQGTGSMARVMRRARRVAWEISGVASSRLIALTNLGLFQLPWHLDESRQVTTHRATPKLSIEHSGLPFTGALLDVLNL